MHRDFRGLQRMLLATLDVNNTSAFYYIIGVLHLSCRRGYYLKGVARIGFSCGGNEVVIKMFVKSTNEKGALLEPANMDEKAKLAEAERLVMFYNKNALSVHKESVQCETLWLPLYCDASSFPANSKR
jgi:hypothetical protein